MKTISSVVEHYMPELEQEIGKDVKQGAVVMSLKRLSEDLNFRVNHKIIKVLKGIGEITVRSSLTDYTFAVSDTILNKQAELISNINATPDVFYTSSRGVNETNVVVSSTMNPIVERLFADEKQIERTDNLASITVKLPKENISTPGVYYYIFQRLAWEGIIINEVISTSYEFTILVNDQEVDMAFKVIKDLKSL
jgi:aspartokinase